MLTGKKLLIITSDASDIAIVQEAQKLGVYVVCCDRYDDWDRSPAKKLADEAWNMDYSDTGAVAEACRKAGIDGVIAGYGEDRVAAAARISKALGTPFYATEEQIDLTRNKKLFKALCKKHGVPVPRDYDPACEQIVYPVIVKPDDNGGRKGISVCHTPEQLRGALSYARENSKTGQVVVEEYVTGTELCAVYTMADGQVSLSCLNDKYSSEDPRAAGNLCDFTLTPSAYYGQYLRQVDPGIRALLQAIGARNGVANIQMIAGEHGICVFEMGYRINGNNDYQVIEANNGINFLQMLITYSLTGSMGDDLSKDDPCFDRYYASMQFYLRGGTVGSISCGSLDRHPDIGEIYLLRQPGAQVPETGTNAQKAMMVKFSGNTREEIAQTARLIRENVQILDAQGNDMMMLPFRGERLLLEES